MTMQSASMSSSTVMKMNAKAARLGATARGAAGAWIADRVDYDGSTPSPNNAIHFARS